MTEKKKAEPQEHEKLVLVSPGGHKYELTVNDHGSINTKYVKKEESEQGSEA